MDSNGIDNGVKSELTIQALDQGCLQELFSRCSTNDLPAVAQTCKQFRDLLAESELVWSKRLSADFGMNLHMSHNTHPGTLFPLAKQIYTTPRDETLRFQGTLVNGSVDDMNMWYWVDNLFKKDRSYFCSDASNNVDCLGLLLDGHVQRDLKYTEANRYMRHRCRYAAALFEHIHHPDPEMDNNAENFMTMVDEWSDQQLENFFISLAENLQNDQNNPIGRLLFYDIPEHRIAVEEQRIRMVIGYLKDRLKALKKDLIILQGENENIESTSRSKTTLFDSTVVEKLQPNYHNRLSSIIYELHLSRAGSLTCPVRTGVIFVGIIDRAHLKGLDAKTVAERLQAATKDPVCTAFNGVDNIDTLVQGIENLKIPELACTYCDQGAGVWYEFKEEERENSIGLHKAGKGPLISWKPIVYFQFYSAEEVDVAFEDDDGDSISQEENEEQEDEEEDEDMEDEEEEVEEEASGEPTDRPPASSSLPSSSHGAHSGAAPQEGEQQQRDPWSDADLEDMSQSQPLYYPAAAAAAGAGVEGVAAGPAFFDNPAAAAAAGEEQQEEDNFEEEGEPLPPMLMVDHTIGRNELSMTLQRPFVADVLMVKLINQENLMDELLDGHSYPNIDMTYVHIVGKKISMPEGIELSSSKVAK